MEENKSIWERLHSGETINMRTDAAFARDTIPEMNRSLGLCTKINTKSPYDKETRCLEEELFSSGLSAEANILSPMEIDYGCQVTILTVNHDLKDKISIMCSPVVIKKDA